MAQYLKEEVRKAICEAALRVFAAEGYRGATMAAIAREAGVATGNVYRYYGGKEALFRAVVPDAFVEEFLSLLRERVDAARGTSDIRGLGPSHPYPVAAERQLAFAIQHRLRVVLLLGRSEGTPYEGVAEKIVDELVQSAIRHFRELDPDLAVSPALRFDLVEIYRNYVGALVRILERYDDPDAIREATRAYARYHLVGLESFFNGNGP